jgi:peptide/nickel transport system substrate-binding protein
MGEWERGQYITVERNENYWDDPLPYLDQIIMQVIPDPTARAAAIETGDVDIITDYFLPKEEYNRLIEVPGIVGIPSAAAPYDFLLMMNTRNAPFDNVAVRQAMFAALDRDLIVENVFDGLADPGVSSITPNLGWMYNPDVDYREQYAYDPDRAMQLLDEAGYPAADDGVRFTVEAVYEGDRASFEPLMQTIRDNLRDVGVTVELSGLERSLMQERVFANADFDLTLQAYTTGGDATIGVQRAYHTRSIDAGNSTNASGYSNPELDAAFDIAAASLDQTVRSEAFYEAQVIIAEDVPTLTFIHAGLLSVYRDHVKDFGILGDEGADWFQLVWLDE